MMGNVLQVPDAMVMYDNHVAHERESGVTSTFTEEARETPSKYYNFDNYHIQNESYNRPFPQGNTNMWHHSPTSEQEPSLARNYGDEYSRITSPIKAYDQSFQLFQFEYGVLLSEILNNCKLHLEELNISESRVECCIKRDDGRLQKFIIHRNPQDPNEYSTKSNVKQEVGLTNTNLLEKRSRSADTYVKNGNPMGIEVLPPKRERNEDISKNNHSNKIDKNTIFPSEKKYHGSGFGKEDCNYSYIPYTKPMQLQVSSSSDISLYEESRMYKSDGVAIIERFQRYKVRPVGEPGKIIKSLETTPSENYEDTKISPRISMSEQRRIKPLELKPNNLYSLTPTGGSDDNIHTSKSLKDTSEPSGHAINNLQTNKQLNHLAQSYSGDVSKEKGTSFKVPSSRTLKAVIPVITFTKPQLRNLSSANMKQHAFSYKTKQDGNLRKFKLARIDENAKRSYITKLRNVAVNRLANLESRSVLKNDHARLLEMKTDKQAINQIKLISVKKHETTESLDGVATSGSVVKKEETNDYEEKQNMIHFGNRTAEGENTKNLLSPSKVIENTPSSFKVLGVFATETNITENREATSDSDSLQNKYKLDITTKIMEVKDQIKSSDTKYEGEKLKSELNIQEDTINLIHKEGHTTNTSNHLGGLNEIRSSLFSEETSTNSSGVINNRTKERFDIGIRKENKVYQVSSQHIADKNKQSEISDLQSTKKFSTSVSKAIEATKNTIVSSLETKEQKLSRLNDQIGKISSTITGQSVSQSMCSEKSSPRLINNSLESPESVWHDQKVKLRREAYVKCYKKWTPAPVPENKLDSPILFSSRHQQYSSDAQEKLEKQNSDGDQCSVM